MSHLPWTALPEVAGRPIGAVSVRFGPPGKLLGLKNLALRNARALCRVNTNCHKVKAKPNAQLTSRLSFWIKLMQLPKFLVCPCIQQRCLGVCDLWNRQQGGAHYGLYASNVRVKGGRGLLLISIYATYPQNCDLRRKKRHLLSFKHLLLVISIGNDSFRISYICQPNIPGCHISSSYSISHLLNNFLSSSPSLDFIYIWQFSGVSWQETLVRAGITWFKHSALHNFSLLVFRNLKTAVDPLHTKGCVCSLVFPDPSLTVSLKVLT